MLPSYLYLGLVIATEVCLGVGVEGRMIFPLTRRAGFMLISMKFNLIIVSLTKEIDRT